MTETLKTSIKGGGFLLEDVETTDVFTPEDFTSEHKMISKTTQDFVLNEVYPSLTILKITNLIIL